MDSQDADDSKGISTSFDCIPQRILFSEISINTPIKASYRVKLRVDNADIALTKTSPSTWNLSNSTDVTESSKVTVTLKTGHRVAGTSSGREETVVEISIRDAIREFLDTMGSEISVSGSFFEDLIYQYSNEAI
ncbi:4263_t:CDS:2 [Acaulospora colombiana]|uniref:4263_t:CDS:1 n=1 Tax=Acaulospora colombiana TaxID=27376 RepID=A0ACA9PTW3_9GLOM|nr:4263_t:CDS:2 [Acaulospora colombiana]